MSLFSTVNLSFDCKSLKSFKILSRVRFPRQSLIREFWILPGGTTVIHFTYVQHINQRLVFRYHFTFDSFGPLLSIVFLALIWTVHRTSYFSCFLLKRPQNQSHIATDGQSISKSWCRAPYGTHDQICITFWQLRSCFCGAVYLTRGRVCLLYMLRALARAVFHGSESLGSRDHILLST
jgi:hypothetical protein